MNENEKNKINEKIAMKISFISIVVNIILSVIKLFAGIVASSTSMISDAIHSASDVFSTVIVMFGIKISNKAPDSTHQYGHERIECIAALVLAMTLILIGFEIGINGIKDIFSFNENNIEIPGRLALIVAIISILRS